MPQSYFSHLLWKLKTAFVNSVRETRHLKPPVWKEVALKVSYKTFNVEDVLHALHEQQRVALCLRKSFNGTKELNVDPAPLSGLEALAAAKNQTAAFRSTRPSQRSVITIGPGNGRSTREFELIWWPLYAQTSSGFLTLRFYIGKVIL